jgi:CSLREA domain-containing protein
LRLPFRWSICALVILLLGNGLSLGFPGGETLAQGVTSPAMSTASPVAGVYPGPTPTARLEPRVASALGTAKSVVIVRNQGDNDEIAALQQYLSALGHTSQVISGQGLTFAQVQNFDLIIWDDQSYAAGGLSDSNVAVFKQAYDAGKPLYLIGDDLATSTGYALSGQAATDWTNLIHLNPASNNIGSGTVTIENTTHPVTNGPSGAVASFAAYIDPDVTTRTNTGEVLLASVNGSPVLLTYEAAGTGVRTVTQNVLVFPPDSASQIEAQKLFKNAVTWLLEPPGSQAPAYVVNSTGDGVDANLSDGLCADSNGKCTLRAAIEQTNALNSARIITFSIPMTEPNCVPALQTCTILPATSLPPLQVANTVVNGYTQPGATANTNTYVDQPFNGQLRVRLHGPGSGTGLTIAGNGSGTLVKGLSITNFSRGIFVNAASVSIVGNLIGLQPDKVPAGNLTEGIRVSTSNNVIGGSAAADANVISANSTDGVVLLGNSNLVSGNYIGVNLLDPNAGAGNGGHGINITAGSTNHTIDRNVISGNGGYGIQVNGNGTTITNNLIGRGSGPGDVAQGNIQGGIRVFGGVTTVSIGTTGGSGNTIAHHSTKGIIVEDNTTQVRIHRNTIYANTIRGIDLGNDGADTNDGGDGDSGPNGKQNYPELTTATNNGGTVTVVGALNSKPNPSFNASQAYRIELFANDSCGPDGQGQGQRYANSQDVLTDGSGHANINLSYSASANPGIYITATATDSSGNTSEFSLCRSVLGATPVPTNTLVVAPTLTRTATSVPATLDLIADKLEVVQAIQDVNNSVGLFANKRTFARFYVHGNQAQDNVKAQLRGYRNNVPLDPPIIYPQNNAAGTISVTTNATPDRSSLASSYYFELPPTWIHSGPAIQINADLNLVGQNAGSGPIPETNYNNNTFVVTGLTFNSASKIKLRVFRVYGDNITAVSDNDLLAIPSEVERMYPVPAFGKSDVKWDDINVKLSTEDLASKDPVVCEKINHELWWRRFYNGRTTGEQWYGVIGNNLPFGCAEEIGAEISSGPNAPYRSPGYDTMASHEIGHALGLKHAICTGKEGAAVSIGYPRSRIGGPSGNPNRYAGFDAGDASLGFAPRAIPSSWTDLMGYCSSQWISDVNYAKLRTAITNVNAGHSPTAPERQLAPRLSGDFLLIMGSLDPTAQAAFLSDVSRLSQIAELPTRVPGPYHIQLLGAGDALLADYPFTPKEPSDLTGTSSITEVVDFNPATQRIVVYSDVAGRVIGSRAVSANPPTVSNVAHSPSGAIGTNGNVTVTWSASDPDGDALTYRVLYSFGNQATWRSLGQASGLSFTIGAEQLEGTSGTASGWFQVIANDGVRTALATEGPFVVAGKAPIARIVSPATNSEFAFGAPVVLAGRAQDREDGSLGDTDLVWSSNQDGTLGSGNQLSANSLSQGTHVLTLTATDSNGQTGIATITVVVTGNPTPPGPTLAVEPDALNYELSEGAAEPNPQTLQIRNGGSGVVNWTASSNAAWVMLGATSGTTPSDLTVTVDAIGLALGVTHQAQITITANGASGSPKVITVTARGELPTSTLNGTVTVQARTPNTLGAQVPLRITLFQPNTSTVITSVTAVTSNTGAFTVAGLPSGTYDIEAKFAIGVGRKVANVILPPGGAGLANFGTLVVGDADNNDRVSAADFTVLKTTFLQKTGCATENPVPGPCADFDGNGSISPADFSLLKANFGVQGPQ